MDNLTTEMIDLLNDFFDKRMRDIIIGCIGKIENHNTETMRADVKPLLKYTATGETISRNFAIIPGIPVLYLFSGGFYVRPEYKRNDLVWVTFGTHQIVQSLRGVPDKTDESIFPRNSAAVVYGISPTGWTPPQEFTEKAGLIAGHVDGNIWFQMTENEIHGKADKLSIEGDLEIDGSVKATGAIESDDEICAKKSTTPVHLSTHTHPYQDTPVGASTTSSPTAGS